MRCLFAPHNRPAASEAECTAVQLPLSAFLQWAEGTTAGQRHASIPASPAWGYASYLYMQQVFGHSQPELASVEAWRSLLVQLDLGLAAESLPLHSENAAFWLGSAGARTRCHRDAYGYNIVAQLYGRKSWRLLPPAAEAQGLLHATRMPYEESTIYAEEDVRSASFAIKDQQHLVDIALEPGDVLLVPHGWWHDVVCTTFSISVNMWLPLDHEDNIARVHEAVVGAGEKGAWTWIDPWINEPLMHESSFCPKRFVVNLLHLWSPPSRMVFQSRTGWSRQRCAHRRVEPNREAFSLPSKCTFRLFCLGYEQAEEVPTLSSSLQLLRLALAEIQPRYADMAESGFVTQFARAVTAPQGQPAGGGFNSKF